jgi:hypothetical protein
MKSKILLGVVVVAGFFASVSAHNYALARLNADQANASAVQQPGRWTYVAPRPVETSYVEPAPQPVRHHCSRVHQALIVGGSATADSAMRAVEGGGKGVAIGVLSGGVADLVYDLAIRNV